MITGDHPETASAIGKQLGISNDQDVFEGRMIDKMSDDELSETVNYIIRTCLLLRD